MNKRAITILKGIGSIMELLPSGPVGDYSRFVFKGTVEDRIYHAWTRVGISISKAAENYSHEKAASQKTG